MTMISSAAGQPASQRSPAGLAASARKLGERPRRPIGRAGKPSKRCSEMDDRALRDIGIARSQIEAAVGGALNPGMARLR